jgi:hypothetical protein
MLNSSPEISLHIHLFNLYSHTLAIRVAHVSALGRPGSFLAPVGVNWIILPTRKATSSAWKDDPSP